MLTKYVPFKFINTRILIIMNPSNAVEMTNRSHVFGQFFRFWPCKVINYRNYITVGCESSNNFLLK